MARLAIKGNTTRGNEVIALLEMLGGNNKYNLRGDEDKWFILNGKLIQRSDRLFAEKGFTLEQFLEKFPYHVGDKVSSKYFKNHKIDKAEWESCSNRVLYRLQGYGWYDKNELRPYIEPIILKGWSQAEISERLIRSVVIYLGCRATCFCN